MERAVQLDDVSVRFVLQHQKTRSFQDALVNFFSPREVAVDEFWALRGVRLEVGRGEAVGLIGQNGSGKSTILKLITRILEPTLGAVSIKGKVSALIELGAGFHPDLTGRENIYLNGSILGLNRKRIDSIFNDIVEFSELEQFIDTPVKHYSSGMYMRLGFSVATCVDPDILIIDEVLAVGDEAFQRKCLDRIFDFKRRGKTIIIVSHALQVVEQLCDRVVWLHHGVVQQQGAAAPTIRSYLRELQKQDEQVREAVHDSVEAKTTEKIEVPRAVGASIRHLCLVDADNRERYSYRTGETLKIRVMFEVEQGDVDHTLELELRRADGLLIQKLRSPRFATGIAASDRVGSLELEIDQLPLLAGTYDVTPGIHPAHEASTALGLDETHRSSFSVWSEVDEVGIVNLEHSWRSGDLRRGDEQVDRLPSTRS